MSTPEIWAREGRDLTIDPRPDGKSAYLRLTDDQGQVTIKYELTIKDLKSLRRWLGKVLK